MAGIARGPSPEGPPTHDETTVTTTIEVAALRDRLFGLTGDEYAIERIRPASTGFANTTWLVDAEPRSLAIKVQRSPAYVHQRDPGLEPDVLAALTSTCVPVPSLIARDRTGDIFGSPWFAMALVDGIGVPDAQLGGYAQEGWFAEAEPAGTRSGTTSSIDSPISTHFRSRSSAQTHAEDHTV